MVDLGKWVNEEYRVPGREVPNDDIGSSEGEHDNLNETKREVS